jgi:hypothetical protein
VQIVQQPHRIIILYADDHEIRHIRMNELHPADVTPSWYGDSIGHYEGDALVIDTVGIKIGPFAMVDWYGTPHTESLHVVERYRLIDYQAALDEERDDGENSTSTCPIGALRTTLTICARDYNSTSQCRMNRSLPCPDPRP